MGQIWPHYLWACCPLGLADGSFWSISSSSGLYQVSLLFSMHSHTQTLGPFRSHKWLYIAQRALVAWRVSVSDIDFSSRPSLSCNLVDPHLSVGSVRNPSSVWRHRCGHFNQAQSNCFSVYANIFYTWSNNSTEDWMISLHFCSSASW